MPAATPTTADDATPIHRRWIVFFRPSKYTPKAVPRRRANPDNPAPNHADPVDEDEKNPSPWWVMEKPPTTPWIMKKMMDCRMFMSRVLPNGLSDESDPKALKVSVI